MRNKIIDKRGDVELPGGIKIKLKPVAGIQDKGIAYFRNVPAGMQKGSLPLNIKNKLPRRIGRTISKINTLTN